MFLFHIYIYICKNWYEPEHHIGLHSDDEKTLKKDIPIFSLSWGGSRRFIFHPKQHLNSDKSASIKNNKSILNKNELILNDGDLLIMGGSTQVTHKHEVPKLRVKDPPSSRRINWTIRAFTS